MHTLKHGNINCKSLSLITYITILLFALSVHAGRAVRQWQTTKSASLGGAGIATPTMVEGLYLNPAMFAFFTSSSFYFQNRDSKIKPQNTSRSSQFGDTDSPTGFSAAITDGSNPSKGGFSYTDQHESGTKRKKFSFGFAGSIDGDSSIGVTYSYVQDLFRDGNHDTKEKFHVGNIGYFNILSPKLSIALIWNDPAWADRINSKTVFGLQYKLFDGFSTMIDFGHDIKRSINKTLYYAMGAEYEFYEQVYVRAGYFQDKLFSMRGYGYGLGWVGPRLGLELAQKKSTQKDDFNTFLMQDEVLKETELSLTYLF